jgi:hypothetical protein
LLSPGQYLFVEDEDISAETLAFDKTSIILSSDKANSFPE